MKLVGTTLKALLNNRKLVLKEELLKQFNDEADAQAQELIAQYRAELLQMTMLLNQESNKWL